MIKVEIVGHIVPPESLFYVVIAARTSEGWVFVRHRQRGGYEMPAGHPDEGESNEAAAVRELWEETGALDFSMQPVSYYCVSDDTGKTYGRLFLAEIQTFGEISDSQEIMNIRIFKRLPKKLSLPEVMTFLFHRAEEYHKTLTTI